MPSYFDRVEEEVDRAYGAAERARREGLDPQLTVEIPRAPDMAMRVEKLLAHLHVDGISEEIRRLSARLPREEVAVAIARRLAQDPERTGSLVDRIDAALRVGLAILTEGILVAPLEGLAEVRIQEHPTKGSYLELYYAGPIRAAGGTAQALSVVLADVVRRDVGIGAYRPESEEVERYKEEIPLYKHFQHLQYVPRADEIEHVVENIPVCITGESTEGDSEVSAFRNLPRVATNGIRGGACLVIAEGLCQKAAKIRKIVDKLALPGWEFLDRIGQRSGTEVDESKTPQYLAEAVGGRPVLAHPGRPGGFRLVYGRARTSGLAACAINPATMILLHRFVAVGTQLKLEYPGKAAAIALCDTIEGPIVELDDGTLTAVHDVSTAERLLPHLRRITDLGQLLVSFGEFVENNRTLEPGDYTIDRHMDELREVGAPVESAFEGSYLEATEVSTRWNVPLAPRQLLFWHDLRSEEIEALSGFVEAHGHWADHSLDLPWEEPFREQLVRLGFPHQSLDRQHLLGDPVLSEALAGGLGLERAGTGLQRHTALHPVHPDSLEYVSRLSGVRILARSPSRIGARVGRPEKAHQRSMKPNVHALFPVGDAGGAQRSVAEAVRRTLKNGVAVQLGRRACPNCGQSTVWLRCRCGTHTEPTDALVNEPLPIAPIWAAALQRLHLRHVPEVKGVKGLTSPGKVPELLDKGILRAVHGVSVYQDGTARFDLTDLPLTHFRPFEIGATLERLHSLGYATDWNGDPLTSVDQLVELFPQDLIVSRSCGAYLLKLAQFVDDELIRLYNLEPFYGARTPEDLLGSILVALAPHTSGGVAGRLVGYTDAEACFAHPVFHAAKRRNCDGDEDSVALLLDVLLNFSRSYLPESRGSLMDKPLVLTTRIASTEVDQEAHNLDVEARYPLALYRAAEACRPAKELAPRLDSVGLRLGTDRALSDYGFTHDTTEIAGGPVRSAYREAGSMARIVEQSLRLSTQIRAVDVADAVSLVLNTHFLPDLMGNLKSYATQKFRCKKCGTSFRRPPLSGRCNQPIGRNLRCDGALLPTVHEASVRKYLVLSQQLSSLDGVPPYVRQRVALLASSLSTLFPGTPEQTTLYAFDRAPEEAPAPEDRP